jgi:hypothetical protein
MRFVIVLVVVGCGSSNGSTDGNSKQPDAAHYAFGCGTGSACTLDDVCCSMPGPSTTFGCVAPAACQMADQITCDGPDKCGGTTPVCCGVYAGNGTGSYPQCGIATLGTSCTSAAQCPTHLESTCSDTTKVQLCHASADCTDSTNNKCCTFTSNGASLSFCIDSVTAGLGGATCN